MCINALYFDFFINFILSLKLKVRHVTQFLASNLVIYIPSFFPWQFYTDKNHGILGKQTQRHLFQLLTDFLTKKLRIWITKLLLLYVLLLLIFIPFFQVLSQFRLNDLSRSELLWPFSISHCKVWGLGLENFDRLPLQHLFQLLTDFLKKKFG